MELDSGKKSRRDRVMRSNSFETQEVRKIGRKEQESQEAFPSYGWNKWKMSSRWKERNAKTRKD